MYSIPAGPRKEAHGWWTVNDEKMSKSLGNFITVDSLLRLLRRRHTTDTAHTGTAVDLA